MYSQRGTYPRGDQFYNWLNLPPPKIPEVMNPSEAFSYLSGHKNYLENKQNGPFSPEQLGNRKPHMHFSTIYEKLIEGPLTNELWCSDIPTSVEYQVTAEGIIAAVDRRTNIWLKYYPSEESRHRETFVLITPIVNDKGTVYTDAFTQYFYAPGVESDGKAGLKAGLIYWTGSGILSERKLDPQLAADSLEQFAKSAASTSYELEGEKSRIRL